MLDHLLPGDIVMRQALVASKNMGDKDGRGAGTVAVHGTHIAAKTSVEKAMDLALGVVKTPGACPTIGAAENRAWTMPISNPAELGAEKVQCLVPFDLDERVSAAVIVGSRAALEPTLPDHRTGDASSVAQRVGKVLNKAIGVGIAGMGLNDEFAVAPGG